MDKFPFLGAAHTGMLEQMYEDFVKNPDSIHEDWRSFFQGFDFAKELYTEEEVNAAFQKEFKVINLIDAYRKRGHPFTQTNPVRERRSYTPNLSYKNFGLSEQDLNIEFQAGDEVGLGFVTLKKIISHLENVYCQSI